MDLTKAASALSFIFCFVRLTLAMKLASRAAIAGAEGIKDAMKIVIIGL
jgi:hypothetical protein